ncbi:MAG: right-handed parallel beta-helix repeat-containing protein [Prevotella sp.]
MMTDLKRYIFTILSVTVLMLLHVACTDEDSFSTSRSNILTFSTDTVMLDTVFSKVPTQTYSFWVYNRSGDGIRCSRVRLENGNQTGFRVNVDGEYLSPSAGYQVQDVEIRNKDSIRVFVELTSPENGMNGPQKTEDNLVFILESGVEQRVNLCAYTWDATLMKNVTVAEDMTLDGRDRPIVIYGMMKVEENATLNIMPGTTLYFHSDAGIEVHGRMLAIGTPEDNIILRGDRTDRMFDYLPYDMVSGQWQGVRFAASSYDNVMQYVDLHGSFDGIVCDSSDVSLNTLEMSSCTVHNCQGYGVKIENSKVNISNSQITNTLNNCVGIFGGDVTLRHCTIAQFYPFDSKRGPALAYTNILNDKAAPLVRMDCLNSIVTGYADDQIDGRNIGDEATAFNFRFVNSILRTPETEDEEHIINTWFENVEDTAAIDGERHFKLVNINRQRYDFHLSDKSSAIDSSSIDFSLPFDRDGNRRDDKPDIGCYEFLKDNIEE